MTAFWGTSNFIPSCYFVKIEFKPSYNFHNGDSKLSIWNRPIEND